MTDRPDLTAFLAGLPDEEVATALGHLVVRVLRQSPGQRTEPPSAPTPRWVTQPAAAEIEGIPLSTIRYLTRRGRVKSLGRGKNRRVLLEDLRRELEECAREGRSLRPGGRPKKATP